PRRPGRTDRRRPDLRGTAALAGHQPDPVQAGVVRTHRRGGRGRGGHPMRRNRRQAARLQRSPGEGLDRAVLDPRPRRRARRPRTRRSAALLIFMALFMLGPLSPASAAIPNPDLPTLNDACSPAKNPAPEQYGSGTDGMIKPPNYPSEQLKNTPVENLTYYD